MNKTISLLFVLIPIGLTSCSQDLTCEDFKIGTFYIQGGSDNLAERDVIIRKENLQLEYRNGIKRGTPLNIEIEWIDDCTYRLNYAGSDTKLDERGKLIQSNNGIVVSKISIEGKCMTYKATMTYIDGREETQIGEICKK